MVRERKAEPELGSELGAEVAGAQQPDFGHTHIHGHGLHVAERMLFRKIIGYETKKLVELLRKFIRENGLAGTPERERGDGVGAGRASEAEINPTGMQRFEHAKLLSNMKRGVIWQHHATRTDADALRGVRDVTDHQFGNGTRDQ